MTDSFRNKSEIKDACSKYYKTSVLETRMVISKEANWIIFKVKDLIKECLSCDLFQKDCDKYIDLVNYLKQNDKERF